MIQYLYSEYNFGAGASIPKTLNWVETGTKETLLHLWHEYI